MLELAIIPLLALHLLCVNVASAGPLVCIFLEWKEGRGDKLAGAAAAWLGGASFWTLLIGGLLGLAIGWLSWSPEYAVLWKESLSHKAMWGIAEYAFSGLLAVGYLFMRRSPHRFRGVRLALLLLSGSNLLYHFPFLFAVAHDVLLSEQLPPPLLASEFRGWMARPDVLARVVHVILASFAVTGVALLGYAMRLRRLGTTSEGSVRVARWGSWTALVTSLLQIPVGLWLVAVLPAQWQTLVLGGDLAAVLFLGASVLLALFMLQDLASITFGEVERKHLVRVMVLMLLVVLLMTGVLRRMRPQLGTSQQSFTASVSIAVSP